MDPRDGPDRFSLVAKREGLLSLLADRPLEKPEIVETLDRSRSTVDRAIRRLAEAGLVERGPGGYESTLTGRLAVERHRDYRRAQTELLAAEPLLSALPPGTTLPPDVVADATATVADDGPASTRVCDDLVDALRDATAVEAVVPRLADSRPLRACHELLGDDGVSLSLVLSGTAARRLCEEFPHLSADLVEREAADVRVGTDLPYSLYVVRDADGTRVTLVVSSDGDPLGRFDATSDEAAAWADERLSAVREHASPDVEALEPAADRLGRAPPDADPWRTLRRAGVRRITDGYFRGRDPADPVVAWRTGFDLVDVRAGHALARERPLPAPDGGVAAGEATNGPADGDSTGRGATGDTAGETGVRESEDGPSRRRVTADLLDRLAEGGTCAVLGPPGMGKSTTCRAVACEWVEAGRGTVLHRPADAAGSPFDADDLVAAVADLAGETLVVVEDATAAGVVEAVHEFVARTDDRTGVSVLLEARTDDWTAAGDRLADEARRAVRRTAITEYHLPAVDERECERAVAAFESATGRSVPVGAEQLYGRVANEGGVGELYRTSQLLLAHTDPEPRTDATGRGPLDAEVDAVVDDLVDPVEFGDGRPPLALVVAGLVGVLTAAELPVAPGPVHAVAAEREGSDPLEAHAAVDEALEGLEGDLVVTPRADRSRDRYRTRHPQWAVRFLDRLHDRTGEDAVAAVEAGVSALFGLADDPARRDRIEQWLGRAAPAVERFADPGAVDGVVESVFETATDGRLAPLFGRTDESELRLPAARSPATDLACSAARLTAWKRRGDYEAVVGEADTLRARVRAAEVDPSVRDRYLAESYAHLASVAQDRDELTAARAHYRAGLRAVDAERTPRAAVRLRCQLASVLGDEGDYDAAGRHVTAGLETASTLGAVGATAEARRRAADLAWRRGDYDAAEDHLETALSIDRELGDREGLADSLNLRGLVADERGEYAAAVEYYRRSLEHSRALSDRREVAVTLLNLGFAHVALERTEDAVACLEESAGTARDLGMDRLRAAAYSGLGAAAADRGDYEAAFEYHAQQRALYEDVDYPHGAASADAAVGDVHRERGTLDGAVEHYERAFEGFADIGAAGHAADVAEHLVDVHRGRDEDAAAREWCRRGREVATDAGLDDRAAAFADRLEESADPADD